jgi:hypothetical protein
MGSQCFLSLVWPDEGYVIPAYTINPKEYALFLKNNWTELEIHGPVSPAEIVKFGSIHCLHWYLKNDLGVNQLRGSLFSDLTSIYSSVGEVNFLADFVFKTRRFIPPQQTLFFIMESTSENVDPITGVSYARHLDYDLSKEQIKDILLSF